LDDAGRLGIALDQDLVELLLREVLGRLLAERIVARLAETVAPALDHLTERTAARAVADETLTRPELRVVSVDGDGVELETPVDDRRGVGVAHRANAVGRGGVGMARCLLVHSQDVCRRQWSDFAPELGDGVVRTRVPGLSAASTSTASTATDGGRPARRAVWT